MANSADYQPSHKISGNLASKLALLSLTQLSPTCFIVSHLVWKLTWGCPKSLNNIWCSKHFFCKLSLRLWNLQFLVSSHISYSVGKTFRFGQNFIGLKIKELVNFVEQKQILDEMQTLQTIQFISLEDTPKSILEFGLKYWLP